jgi:hypothetical protein
MTNSHFFALGLFLGRFGQSIFSLHHPGFRFIDCLGGNIFCGNKFFFVLGFNSSELGLSFLKSLCIGYEFSF